MDRQRDAQTDRWIDIQMDKIQIGELSNEQTDRWIYGQMDKKTHGQTVR